MAVLTISALAPGAAHALQQDITITPTSVSPVINPGSAYHGSFQVVNQGKIPYKFIDYATPYNVKGEDYTPEFTVLPTAPNVVSWFNFSAPNANVNSGQSRNINYTITVPENTQAGGYYAAAFAETQYPKSSNGITLNERVGELFYIQVAGPVVKKGELLTWQSNFLQKAPLTSFIRLQDDGSIHYPADIQMQIKDIFGNTKYTLNSQKELLPQTIRKISLPWAKTPAFGLFKVSGNVSFLNHHETLSTKWVLVMSNTVRLIVAVIVVLFILFFGIQRTRSPGKQSKKSKQPPR